MVHSHDIKPEYGTNQQQIQVNKPSSRGAVPHPPRPRSKTTVRNRSVQMFNSASDNVNKAPQNDLNNMIV